MKVHRGEVVLLDHPFSDGRGSKVRPALVVQEDGRNAAMDNTIVAIITKTLQRVSSDPSQFLIDITTPDGKLSGLKATSAVTCGNLFTVHEDRIHRKIGVLPAALMQKVNGCLKAALDLP
jgi:mRNA interferase MazF